MEMSTATDSLANTLSSLGLSATTNTATADKSNANELNQKDFLKLLIAQLKNQSPLDPVDNAQFVSQMAQFGTVNGIQELQSSFQSLSSSLLSNQTLQASSLVGRSVAVSENNTAILSQNGRGIDGTLMLTEPAANVQVSIKDSGGNVVKTASLGNANAGNLDFHWDGLMADGQAAPAGAYQITATGIINNQNTALNVAAANQVTSITLGSGGSSMQLNLANGTQTSFNNIAKIF